MYKDQNKKLHNTLKQVPFYLHLESKQFEYIKKGEELWLDAGDKLITEGNFWRNFCILLEGELECTKKIGDSEVYLLSLKTGAFFGHEVFFSDVHYPVTVRAVCNCYLFLQNEKTFWNMLMVDHSIAQTICTTATHRLRNLEAASQHYAKLQSLGTIASGIAHEMNNPAAAACRTIESAYEAIITSRTIYKKLQQGSVQEISKILIEIEENAKEYAQNFKQLKDSNDLLAQSEHEEEIISWLENYRVVDAWKLGPALLGIGLNQESLNTLFSSIPSEILIDVLLWLEARLSTKKLLTEAKDSVYRIMNLVEAVKDYSYMDRSPQQAVDVQEGIKNTLIILGQKLKDQGIVVDCQYHNNLPFIMGYGSELNQVWTNLIDNALDAVAEKIREAGKICIRVSLSEKYVRVEIIDNGLGIATNFEDRLFEPFFTTKVTGKGLGLTTVYRIVVNRHRGYIHFDSKPGNTSFQIFLPVIQS